MDEFIFKALSDTPAILFHGLSVFEVAFKYALYSWASFKALGTTVPVRLKNSNILKLAPNEQPPMNRLRPEMSTMAP